MIITVLGWGMVIIIFLIISLCIYYYLDSYLHKKKVKDYYKTLEDASNSMRHARYWLNSKEREPYQKFYDYILDSMKNGRVSGDFLRQKVDEIIKENRTI